MNDLLEKSKLSQKELAEKAGWSEGYVSRILSGRQNLTLKTLARFEAAVGADVLEVTQESRSPTPEIRPDSHIIVFRHQAIASDWSSVIGRIRFDDEVEYVYQDTIDTRDTFVVFEKEEQ